MAIYLRARYLRANRYFKNALHELDSKTRVLEWEPERGVDTIFPSFPSIDDDDILFRLPDGRHRYLNRFRTSNGVTLYVCQHIDPLKHLTWDLWLRKDGVYYRPRAYLAN